MSESCTLVQPGIVPARSETYYYDTVVFEVEGTLYRVCKYGFEQYSRSVFRDMFSLPQGLGETQEGETDENPIKLVGRTKAEFESLLEVIQPRRLGPPKLSKQQWVDVLRLGRVWDMPEVAAIAIENVWKTKLSPIESILLGRVHAVPSWLEDGYTSLVGADQSETPLEQLKLLGWETACLILWARSQITQPIGKQYCGYCLYEGQKEQKMSKKPDGTACCKKCKMVAHAKGWSPYTLVEPQVSPMKLQVVVDKVKVLFGEELKEAELHCAQHG